jgi:hypothetical protein
MSVDSTAKGQATLNFVPEINKLAICEAFGYTEDEYDKNSIEFNIMAGYYLDAKGRASKAANQNLSKGKKR